MKKKIILDVHKIQIILSKFGPEKILKKLEQLNYEKYISKKLKKKFNNMFIENKKISMNM